MGSGSTDADDDAAAHQFRGQQAHRPAFAPRRRRRAADGHQVRLDRAINLGRHGRRQAFFAFQGHRLAAQHETFADRSNGVQMDPQGFGDPMIRVAAVAVVAVGHQDHAGVKDLFCRRRAVAGDVLQTCTGLGGEIHRVFDV
jgi:hypothetical protein